jgi:hypothetical protein
MGTKTLKRKAEKAIVDMGYALQEWTATREGWVFGFVKRRGSYYGCIAFESTGMISVEILKRKEYKTFSTD